MQVPVVHQRSASGSRVCTTATRPVLVRPESRASLFYARKKKESGSVPRGEEVDSRVFTRAVEFRILDDGVGARLRRADCIRKSLLPLHEVGLGQWSWRKSRSKQKIPGLCRRFRGLPLRLERARCLRPMFLPSSRLCAGRVCTATELSDG